MSGSNSEQASTWGGMGRWVAVASELPCAVIALLFAGQIIGQSIGGPSGGMWGAVLGSLLGFAFGVYSVYITIGYFDRLELESNKPRRYMPPMEEIMEDVKFDIDSSDDESDVGE